MTKDWDIWVAMAVGFGIASLVTFAPPAKSEPNRVMCERHNASPSNQEDCRGIAFQRSRGIRVIDGDTIVWRGLHVRLDGIDAPELSQLCRDGWAGGLEAKKQLEILIKGLEAEVECSIRAKDRYHRSIGDCAVGTKSLNATMVARGLAYAYRSIAYKPIEQQAKQKNLGVHAHSCELPWRFRKEGH